MIEEGLRVYQSSHVLTPWQYDKKPVNSGKGLDFLKVLGQILDSRHAQVAIYTVFHEEYESDVKNK